MGHVRFALKQQIHQDQQNVNVIKVIRLVKSLEWSKSSKLSVQQSAFKRFSRAVKLHDFRLKIKNKCQHFVGSSGTEVITPS